MSDAGAKHEKHVLLSRRNRALEGSICTRSAQGFPLFDSKRCGRKNIGHALSPMPDAAAA